MTLAIAPMLELRRLVVGEDQECWRSQLHPEYPRVGNLAASQVNCSCENSGALPGGPFRAWSCLLRPSLSTEVAVAEVSQTYSESVTNYVVQQHQTSSRTPVDNTKHCTSLSKFMKLLKNLVKLPHPCKRSIVKATATLKGREAQGN